MKITIHIKGTSFSAEYKNNVLLSDVIITHSPLSGHGFPCGGNGKCRKCAIRAFGCLSPLTEAEKKAFSDEDISLGYRLACMTYSCGDTEIFLDESQKQLINSDLKLPEDFIFTPQSGYGIACDIGTTTVVMCLYDLSTGELISSIKDKNPQSCYGSDVVTRIEKGLEQNGLQLLHDSITCFLKKMFSNLCGDRKIKKAVITGNTVMLYLLLKKDVRNFAAYPFKIPDFLDKKFTYNDVEVYIPPVISAFLGADILCAALCSGIDKNDGYMICDIGTNGEIIFNSNGKLIATSTSAGPAFEGVGISAGSPAVDGAIFKVDENGDSFTIGNGDIKPGSVCGSGLIDAIKYLLTKGNIDETGYSVSEIMPIGNTGLQLIPQDIRAFQLAKAAIAAGICILRKQALATPTRLFIAGGFGSSVNIDNCRSLGMIPKNIKTIPVGNSALGGAVMLLLNEEYKKKATEIASKTISVDLSEDKDFNILFADRMYLEEFD